MRLLLTGASGHLGAFLLREAWRRELQVSAWSGHTAQRFAGYSLLPVDLTNSAKVEDEFKTARPAVVVHAAALSAIADCHREPTRAQAINVNATKQLAALAAAAGARFVYVSTDLVFDGRKGDYTETDEPNPLSMYARTKLAGEEAVLKHAGAAVVRMAWLAGPKLLGSPRFFDDVVAKLRAGQQVQLFVDEFRSPLGLPTAAAALWNLAASEVAGVVHLGGPERLSRYEMGRLVAAHVGSALELVQPARREDLPAPEPRPADVSLDSSRWRQLFPATSWATYQETLTEVLPPETGAVATASSDARE